MNISISIDQFIVMSKANRMWYFAQYIISYMVIILVQIAKYLGKLGQIIAIKLASLYRDLYNEYLSVVFLIFLCEYKLYVLSLLVICN